jgi:hypothetical protein
LSFAVVEQTQTNGVAERFIRTCKEQAVWGRLFPTTEALRAATAAFVDAYNAEWRPKRLGFMTPREARGPQELRTSLGRLGVIVCPEDRGQHAMCCSREYLWWSPIQM